MAQRYEKRRINWGFAHVQKNLHEKKQKNKSCKKFEIIKKEIKTI